MNDDLKRYIEREILPRYDGYDKAHQLDHINKVINQSLEIASHFDVDTDMVYAIAAYHDLGIVKGREFHHIESAKMLLADDVLKQYFTQGQLVTMAEAIEDHRASAKNEPRGIYGRIVAEADRQIDPHTIILRTIQYGLNYYPELEKEEQYDRMLKHLKEKYGYGGYLKLHFEFSENHRKLEQLREMMNDEKSIRAIFDQIWESNRNN
ncbi:MAG: HD domain-containing protein [Bacteroidales bacterium]|nr:HD domain-containing protein [Bacteroidales bacterium]